MSDGDRFASMSHALADRLYAGRTALVSGGGSGIGEATAWLLARLGARIVICGRTPAKLDRVATAFAAAGHEILATPTDIRDETAVERLLDAAEERFGAIDLLVNNAGGQYAQAAIDIVPKGWRAVIENNLTGGWLMMQAAARRWIAANRGGAIVNMAASAERGMPGIIHSGAARAAMINASRTAAVEWAEHDIRVNCVAPGLIDSGGLDVYPPAARAAFDKANPQRRLGDPWEVAQAIAFLGSDAASFITGATLTIDGGGALSGELWTHRAPPYHDQEQDA